MGLLSYTFFEEELVNLKLSKKKVPQIKNSAKGNLRETR